MYFTGSRQPFGRHGAKLLAVAEFVVFGDLKVESRKKAGLKVYRKFYIQLYTYEAACTYLVDSTQHCHEWSGLCREERMCYTCLNVSCNAIGCLSCRSHANGTMLMTSHACTQSETSRASMIAHTCMLAHRAHTGGSRKRGPYRNERGS